MVFRKMKDVLRFSYQQKSQEEYQLARVLVVIVVVFIICHIPRLGLNFDESLNPGRRCYSSFYFIAALLMSKIFLAINSSVNVLIYGCLNKTFRSAIFCRIDSKSDRECNLEASNMATQMIELHSYV